MRDMQQVSDNLLIQTPDRSNHNLDTQTLTTSAFGRLTPVFHMETVPGGTYTISPETLVRFQPLVAPVMHKCDVKVMYFYVPYRILWRNWEYFITGKKDPITSNDPSHPYFPASYIGNTPGPNGVNSNRLADYFGLKKQLNGNSDLLSPFLFAAYQKIYNRYFRHKAVQEEVYAMLEDGLLGQGDFDEMSTLREITFDDDYFNAVLPTPQAGEPIFIDDNANILRNKEVASAWTVTTPTGTETLSVDGVPLSDPTILANQLYATMQINVEEIRRAAALQKFVEAENHTHNYIDYLKVMYNVDFPDGRALEPEYIGGVSQPITISDVMNTADNNQGRLTGNATGYAQGGRETITTHEHGLIIGLAVATYKSTYVNAVPKHLFKLDRFDYFNPQFDGLGEQVVTQGEINGLIDTSDETFGYVPRHHEYRSSYDRITGEMSTSYMHWHLARNYAGATGLTADFYNVLDERRIFAFQGLDYDPIMYQVYNNVRANLPMGKLPQRIL